MTDPPLTIVVQRTPTPRVVDLRRGPAGVGVSGTLQATVPLTVDGDHAVHDLTGARTLALALGLGLAVVTGALAVDENYVATRTYAAGQAAAALATAELYTDSVLGGYVPVTRQVIAGSGLSGGGALSSNVSLTVDTSIISTRAYADSVGVAAIVTADAHTATALAGYVPVSRTVTAGAGLTGGGALSGNLTLDIGAGTGITVAADAISVNYGATSVTACVGDDSRLSNSRTPSTSGTNGGAMVYVGGVWTGTAAAASGGMSLLAAATPSNAPAFGWSNRLGDGASAVTLQGATFAVTGSIGTGTTALWATSNGAATPYNASTGTQVHIQHAATINQSSTAAFDLLQILLTKTAVGSGARNLIKTSVGGVAKWTLDDTGAVVSAGGLDATGQVISRAAGSGVVAVNGKYLCQVSGTAAAPNYSINTGTGAFGTAGTSFSLASNSVECLRVDNSTTTDDMRFLLYDATAAALVRVSRGAADSGGGGYRLLRIPN